MPKISEIKVKLESNGFSGLYFEGECACSIDDLAPCGECNQDFNEEYINDCQPGYKHEDPKDPYFFVVSTNKELFSDEEWESFRHKYEAG